MIYEKLIIPDNDNDYSNLNNIFRLSIKVIIDFQDEDCINIIFK